MEQAAGGLALATFVGYQTFKTVHAETVGTDCCVFSYRIAC